MCHECQINRKLLHLDVQVIHYFACSIAIKPLSDGINLHPRLYQVEAQLLIIFPTIFMQSTGNCEVYKQYAVYL